MQSAHGIRPLPPRKVSVQGQQKVLFFLQDPLLQAGYAGEDQGRDEVGGSADDIHAPDIRVQTRLSDDKPQTETKKGREGESKCLIGSF